MPRILFPKGEDANGVVPERLGLLWNKVNYLRSEREQVHSLSKHEENTRPRKTVERSVEPAVEVCLDTGRRIIALGGFRYPTENQDVFRVPGEEGILYQFAFNIQFSIHAKHVMERT
jgi:uncharacterized protein YutE (UPF0331/DUF86 family)